MAPPTVVALDLMDTVVRDPVRAALHAATGLALREVLSRRDPDAWPRFERGEIGEEEYVAAHGDLPFDVDAFHRERRAGYAFVPGMDALLDDLAGHVVRVAATNYPVWVRELATDLLDGRFEQVVASHELGVRKPDRRFYRALCSRVGAEPEEIAFVDDREDNARAAAALGLRAHRFVGAGALRRWLRGQGLGI